MRTKKIKTVNSARELKLVDQCNVYKAGKDLIVYKKVEEILQGNSRPTIIRCVVKKGSKIVIAKQSQSGEFLKFRTSELLVKESIDNIWELRQFDECPDMVFGRYDRMKCPKNGWTVKSKRLFSLYDRKFEYEIGKTAVAAKFDTRVLKECSFGLHFFATFGEAFAW